MRRTMPLLAAALVATLAVPGSARDADPLAGRVAGKPQSCVSASPASGLVIAGPDTVMVNRTSRRIWVAKAIGCPALRRNDTLIVEHLAGGTDYCASDRIRSLPPGGIIPGPYCRLSKFTPYDKPR